ncbi:hypothetical protein HMPREF2141_00359 [Bacteroides uniformis]|nr:hypothetical protein HMPREF2141_00359 [Bacteroides uniformis]
MIFFIGKKVTNFFVCYEIISTFATSKQKEDDSELYIYSTVWYYYSTGKV